jgi:3-deoxy-D-manno-octulosonic-acid transferase
VPHETDENSLKSLTQIFHQHKISIYSEPTENADILIVDKKGLLKYLYRYAQVAYVGGGFGQGIHNILEAAAYNIPVICGPKIQKSNEALVLNAEKILTVITSGHEMRDAIIQFNEENRYVSIQQKTEKCFKEQLRNSPSELMKEALKPYLS